MKNIFLETQLDKNAEIRKIKILNFGITKRETYESGYRH